MPTWDVVSRYAAQHSTARSSKPKPLAWRSPLRRRGRALATYATPRRPAHPPYPPFGARPPRRDCSGRRPVSAPRSLPRPIVRPHPSAAGMAASGGDAPELAGKPLHLAHPPARRVAGWPALYALCAIDRTPEFVRVWICLFPCLLLLLTSSMAPFA